MAQRPQQGKYYPRVGNGKAIRIVSAQEKLDESLRKSRAQKKRWAGRAEPQEPT